METPEEAAPFIRYALKAEMQSGSTVLSIQTSDGGIIAQVFIDPEGNRLLHILDEHGEEEIILPKELICPLIGKGFITQRAPINFLQETILFNPTESSFTALEAFEKAEELLQICAGCAIARLCRPNQGTVLAGSKHVPVVTTRLSHQAPLFYR